MISGAFSGGCRRLTLNNVNRCVSIAGLQCSLRMCSLCGNLFVWFLQAVSTYEAVESEESYSIILDLPESDSLFDRKKVRMILISFLVLLIEHIRWQEI